MPASLKLPVARFVSLILASKGRATKEGQRVSEEIVDIRLLRLLSISAPQLIFVHAPQDCYFRSRHSAKRLKTMSTTPLAISFSDEFFYPRHMCHFSIRDDFRRMGCYR